MSKMLSSINNKPVTESTPEDLLSPFLDQAKKILPTVADEYERRVGELRQYAAIVENPYDLSGVTNRVKLMTQMSYAFRKATEASGWCRFLMDRLANNVTRSIAIAAHDKFEEYIEQRGKEGVVIRSTDSMRKWYIDIDEDVYAAREKYAIVKAMEIEISGLEKEFDRNIKTLHAMCYGANAEIRMNSASMSHEIESTNKY